MLANLWYSEGILERSGAFASFVELVWISEEWKQSSKLLELRSFNMCKNAIVPIIVMLGCLKIDLEVSDAGMETTKFNDCRVMLGNDGDINGVLATIQEGARFSCKDGWKFINPFI